MESIAGGSTPYCGTAPSPQQWLTAWNLDPWLLALLGAALAYALTRHGSQRLHLGLAVAGMAVLFVSPLCALTSALFAARTVHHLLLIGLVAPLLAWAAPRLDRSHLALAALVHQAVFWLWHAPAAYDAALASHALYWAMQISILASAVWFWAQVRAASAPAAVAALLATMVGMGLLGAILTFAPSPLYTAHALGPLLWGTTPLADQQAAGLIMWVPGSALYLGCALVLLARLIGPSRSARPA